MYTKSELEGMTFKELKRLARKNSISQCWTSKVITVVAYYKRNGCNNAWLID